MSPFVWSLAGLFFLCALVRWHDTPRYRCVLCGTDSGRHGKRCPFRDKP